MPQFAIYNRVTCQIVIILTQSSHFLIFSYVLWFIGAIVHDNSVCTCVSYRLRFTVSVNIGEPLL